MLVRVKSQVETQVMFTVVEPGSICRAMPLPVIGSVSEPEAIGLGKLYESQSRKQTGTLFNGIDFAPEVDGSCVGQLKAFFVHRTGVGHLLILTYKNSPAYPCF